MSTTLDYKPSLTTHNTKDNYICDCGQRCTNQIDLDQHKLNNCENRLLKCSFCQDFHPSTIALRDHLMLCGNKTDQCPNCRKFIRRAVFAYHYENNCADLEEDDVPTPAPRSKRSSTHRSSSKSNKSTTQENDINTRKQENDQNSESSNNLPKSIERVSSITSNKRNSLMITQCEFCNNEYALNDYETHKESCLQNPNNLSKSRQRTSSISKSTESRPSTSERRRSPDIAYIPCEFCNEPIDLRDWLFHVEACRDRELRRIEARAEIINREPVPEKLPCEHCEQLFLAEQLRTHQINCEKNPENITRTTRLTNRSSLGIVELSNKSSKTERDSRLLSSRSSLPSSLVSSYNHSSRSRDILDQEYTTEVEDKRFSFLTITDTKRIQDNIRTLDNSASSPTIRVDQSSKQQRANDDISSRLINSSRTTSVHDTLPVFSNDRPISGTLSLSRRLRNTSSLDRTSFDRQLENCRPMPQRTPSPSTRPSRSQSASRNSLDARGSQRINATKAVNPHLVNDNVLFHSPRQEDSVYQPKLNQRDRTTTNDKKSRQGIPLCHPPMKFK